MFKSPFETTYTTFDSSLKWLASSKPLGFQDQATTSDNTSRFLVNVGDGIAAPKKIVSFWFKVFCNSSSVTDDSHWIFIDKALYPIALLDFYMIICHPFWIISLGSLGIILAVGTNAKRDATTSSGRHSSHMHDMVYWYRLNSGHKNGSEVIYIYIYIYMIHMNLYWYMIYVRASINNCPRF